MGMLFGGWYKEIEEEYGSYENYEKEKAKWPVPSNPPKEIFEAGRFINGGDIIGSIFNIDQQKMENEALVKEVFADGKMIVCFLDGRNDLMKEVWPYPTFIKLCSTIEA